ncbi:MAG: 50S ribosomal protein L11 methyltransferase [Thermodesulfobacteriota bacterium]|nr:50S ribosomal protein L11 methyltransferase [Thermodesulfobacteriota bacterium]
MLEIFVQGPVPDMDALWLELARVFPDAKKFPLPGPENTETAGIVFYEREARLDETLVQALGIMEAVEKRLGAGAKFDIHVRDLTRSEPPGWSEGFKEPFEPVPGLVIRPWDSLSVRAPDENTILLDPKHSFGTGKHPSTRLCLEALAQLAAESRIASCEVLDVGCGTGILAVAAVKMGAHKAIGVDIDPECVGAARKNALYNNLSKAVEIRQGSLDVVQDKYDLVLANLVASVLISVGARIPGYLKDGGLAVVSGFGENQSAEMRRLFEGLSLGIEREFTLDGWSAFLVG